MAISSLDIAWAAGFIEGDGTLGYYKGVLQIRAVQVQKEPLERLQRIFGGNVYRKRKAILNWQEIWCWAASTSKSAQIIMTLFVLFSSRRKAQATKALTLWKQARTPNSPRPGAQKILCVNGHKFSTRPRFDFKGHKVCFICKDERSLRYLIQQKEGEF